MRCRERLVQVHVDYVESDVCRTYDTDYSVEVGAVIVAESAGLMDELCDLHDVRVEETNCVRVGQHQTGRLRTEVSLEVVDVNCTVLVRLDDDGLVARHCSRSRVCAVSGVRYDDLVTLCVASVCVVSLDQQQARELTVSSGCRLEGNTGHARDLAKELLEFADQLVCALYGMSRLQRMQLGESRKSRHLLIDPRVVLHCAGAERIESVVDSVCSLCKSCVVSSHLVLGDLREMRLLLTKRSCRQLHRYIACREDILSSTRNALLEY